MGRSPNMFSVCGEASVISLAEQSEVVHLLGPKFGFHLPPAKFFAKGCAYSPLQCHIEVEFSAQGLAHQGAAGSHFEKGELEGEPQLSHNHIHEKALSRMFGSAETIHILSLS